MHLAWATTRWLALLLLLQYLLKKQRKQENSKNFHGFSMQIKNRRVPMAFTGMRFFYFGETLTTF